MYSTPELLAVEQRVIEHAIDSTGAGAGACSAEAVEAAVAARPTLSDDQRRMVERLCLDGDGVAVVVGHGGTGKTYALGAAREAWQATGIPVLGVAVARRAASELEADAGIASTSIAALLADLARWEGARLPAGCVLVVDEAGMVETRSLARLVEAVDAPGGKLVLVGDHRQLPELEAGGAFRGLVRRGILVELTENRRQQHAWEREALEQLRGGRAEDAVAAYDAHERLVGGGTMYATVDRIVRDWWAARDPEGAVMIAQRRVDVAALNERAREEMRCAGALGPAELELPGGRFSIGDRVVIKRNHLARGVHNGDRASVLAVDVEHGQLRVEVSGRAVTLEADFLHARTSTATPRCSTVTRLPATSRRA